MPDLTIDDDRPEGAVRSGSGISRVVRSVAHRLAAGDMSLPVEGRLPSFDGAAGWLNSEPLTPAGLRGRVVLVQFWTYTCINWLRTLPYVRAWAAKYREDGLTVVGVHTPEFAFERSLDNIVAAARDEDVPYPIGIDSDYTIWQAFANHFWPALYLADAEGRIRFHHFGEGEYAMTEMAIQQLLAEAGRDGFDADLVTVDPHGFELAADWRTLRTPETYLGSGRASGFASREREQLDVVATYTVPDRIPLNAWALAGSWRLAPHAAVLAAPGGTIAFRFQARDAHLVMGPAERGARIPFRVRLEGAAPGAAHGLDVDDAGNGTLVDQRLHQLVRQPGPIGERLLEIEFLDTGVEAYCFTFG
jgi:thiol-disulfide isomerase/thioredoxin